MAHKIDPIEVKHAPWHGVPRPVIKEEPINNLFIRKRLDDLREVQIKGRLDCLMAHASVHRFKDQVALGVSGGRETIYMRQEEARALSKALKQCAEDVKKRSFGKSLFRTVTLYLSGFEN